MKKNLPFIRKPRRNKKRLLEGRHIVKKMQQLCNNQSMTTALQLHTLYVHNYKKIRGITRGPLKKSPLRGNVPQHQQWGILCGHYDETSASKHIGSHRTKKKRQPANAFIIFWSWTWEYKKRGRKDLILSHIFINHTAAVPSVKKLMLQTYMSLERQMWSLSVTKGKHVINMPSMCIQQHKEEETARAEEDSSE